MELTLETKVFCIFLLATIVLAAIPYVFFEFKPGIYSCRDMSYMGDGSFDDETYSRCRFESDAGFIMLLPVIPPAFGALVVTHYLLANGLIGLFGPGIVEEPATMNALLMLDVPIFIVFLFVELALATFAVSCCLRKFSKNIPGRTGRKEYGRRVME